MRRAAHYIRWGLVFFVCILLTALIVPESRAALEAQWERVQFAFDAKAARAYEYGVKHFDAIHPASYDIALAEHYFREARVLDPKLPFVHHQLARIEFLKGDYTEALDLINAELEVNPEPSLSTYYIRALIKGFMGSYESAAKDFERYLRGNPNNWAAANDYAWVLLKVGRSQSAQYALEDALVRNPENAWLLNSYAIALYENGKINDARDTAKRALASVEKLTIPDWLLAYPGNDPKVGAEGLAAFKEAASKNMHSIMLAPGENAIQFNMTHE